jgi:hypothetical protein
VRLPVFFCFCVVFSACRAAAPGPRDTLLAYASALREGRYADAWQLLSPAAQQSMTQEEFVSAARSQPDEINATAGGYSDVSANGSMVARVEMATGETVSLVYEEGQWRLDPASLDFYSQSTPAAALASFVSAVENQRWDVLLRLAPRAIASQLRMASSQPARVPEEILREAWTGPRAQRDRDVLRVLKQSLERGATPERTDDHATLVYGIANQYTARLVREEGVWKVEDID